MFQQGLYALVTQNEAFVTQVGDERPDKTLGLFAMIAPSGPTMPYAVYQHVSGAPATFSYQGANKLYHSRIRFSCYGSTQKGAEQLANTLKALFADFIGPLADGSVIQQVMHDFEADDTEATSKNTIFATHVDFTFFYVVSTTD